MLYLLSIAGNDVVVYTCKDGPLVPKILRSIRDARLRIGKEGKANTSKVRAGAEVVGVLGP